MYSSSLVTANVELKSSLLTFKTDTAAHICDLFNELVPNCTLRSNSSLQLKVPCIKSKDWIQSFQLLWMPSLWNSLPTSVHSTTSIRFFPQVPQNLSVWPCFPTLGLLHCDLSLLMTTDYSDSCFCFLDWQAPLTPLTQSYLQKILCFYKLY